MIAVRAKAEQLYEHVAHVGFAVPASQQLSVQDLGMRAYPSENTKSSSSKTEAEGNLTLAEGNTKYLRQHEDHIAPAGYVSETYYAMVHKPIPIPKAMKIPDALKAVNKEWEKLESIPAWNVNSVKPRAWVIQNAKDLKKKVHFGHIMPLCHQKNAELKESLRSYKGRVVFRGDDVKDENG